MAGESSEILDHYNEAFLDVYRDDVARQLAPYEELNAELGLKDSSFKVYFNHSDGEQVVLGKELKSDDLSIYHASYSNNKLVQAKKEFYWQQYKLDGFWEMYYSKSPFIHIPERVNKGIIFWPTEYNWPRPDIEQDCLDVLNIYAHYDQIRLSGYSAIGRVAKAGCEITINYPPVPWID